MVIQSEIETLDHLQDFENTEFDGKGAGSDHSEYVDTSSSEDEFRNKSDLSFSNLADGMQQGMKTTLSKKVQDVFRRSSVFNHSMKSFKSEEEVPEESVPDTSNQYWQDFKEKVGEIGKRFKEDSEEEEEEQEEEPQFKQVNFKKLLKKERMLGN